MSTRWSGPSCDAFKPWLTVIEETTLPDGSVLSLHSTGQIYHVRADGVLKSYQHITDREVARLTYKDIAA